MSESLELNDFPKGYVSVTQIEMFRRCGQQYYFRYIEGLKIPPGGSLVFGISAHKALEHDMTQKIKTGKNVSTAEAQNVCAEAFDSTVKESVEKSGGVDWGGADPGHEKDACILTLSVFHKKEAQKIEPVASEKPFEITFKETSMKLVGRIDTIDKQASIHDFKTTKKYKKTIEGEIEKPPPFQLVTYQLAEPRAMGIQLDYLIRGKKWPDTAIIKFPPVPLDVFNGVLDEIGKITTAIRTGIFYPNPGFGHINCSMCGYKERCPVWKRKVTIVPAASPVESAV